jgi:hypothetical protein
MYAYMHIDMYVCVHMHIMCKCTFTSVWMHMHMYMHVMCKVDVACMHIHGQVNELRSTHAISWVKSSSHKSIHSGHKQYVLKYRSGLAIYYISNGQNLELKYCIRVAHKQYGDVYQQPCNTLHLDWSKSRVKILHTRCT